MQCKTKRMKEDAKIQSKKNAMQNKKNERRCQNPEQKECNVVVKYK
jgi:hypothetical protein